ncbi:MAG: beta-galactosidase [Clostridia bacterium]|nr:beta-galactosidase [Clostridia bacterium]
MQKIDLSGLWSVYLDETKAAALPENYPDEMTLPGTTSAAGLGPENPARETYFLTDAHKFEGYAWFMRTFESGDWQDLQVQLALERTRKTTVYLDGKMIGHQDSLCTPHRYLLTGLTAGVHTLVVRVDNTDYPTRGGHLTSQDTQSNWNGVTGEISLTVAKAIVSQVQVFPDIAGGSLRLRADVLGEHSGFAAVALPGQMEQLIPINDRTLEGTLPLTGSEALWDEFSPALHTLSINVDGDVYEITFGLRKFEGKGRSLLCNGREVFLRGKHDGLIFPRTGYAPTDVESWRKVLQTAKDYGVNHYRFHTCCPPDAAFTAADELGIAMSPELPFWGTITEEGEEGHNAKERIFLFLEGFRMLGEYGHHPSFVFLSMGNELWGSKKALNTMLAEYRKFDPDKLYVSGANNFQWVPEVLEEEDVFVGVRLSGERLIRGSYAMCDAPQGIVQTTEPESMTNYDRMIAPEVVEAASGAAGKIAIQYGTGVKYVDAESAQAFIPEVPVISHEVGQYEFYPDFDEIEQYTGPLKARNFEVFRERLQAAGLWADHARFFRCAGQLAVDCYRREIETFLRTSELSGFQLLDLQDFTGQGTALVGVLNAFMESKGLITPEGWRQFCASTVVLGEFERFVLACGEEVCFRVRVSECDPRRVHTAVRCELLDGDAVLSARTVPVEATGKRLSAPVSVSLGPVHTQPFQTRCLTVRLTLEDGTVNQYPLWVFPRYPVEITREGITLGSKRVAFVKSIEEAKASAVPAIVIPDSEGKLPATYASDFWCYPMFRSISESMGKPVPIGTLGLCIDAQHPWLTGFAREEYTTPAWYHLLQTAHCETGDMSAPVVQMIDNTERCQRLSLLWLQEGVPHMTFRLWEDAQDISVQAFAAALAEALA